MTYAGSIALMAIGAILMWAVEIELPGVSINVVGIILLIAGLVGLVLSATLWRGAGPFAARRTVVTEEGAPPPV